MQISKSLRKVLIWSRGVPLTVNFVGLLEEQVQEREREGGMERQGKGGGGDGGKKGGREKGWRRIETPSVLRDR